MNIKITRPDGTVIEAEGTVEECQAFALAVSPPPAPAFTLKSRPAQLPLPMTPPLPDMGPQPWDLIYPYQPQPVYPWQTVPYTPEITWWMPSTITTDRLMLGPTSEFAVGSEIALSSGSQFASAGYQCTPTGVNMC